MERELLSHLQTESLVRGQGIISPRSELAFKASQLSHLPLVIGCFGKLALKPAHSVSQSKKAG